MTDGHTHTHTRTNDPANFPSHLLLSSDFKRSCHMTAVPIVAPPVRGAFPTTAISTAARLYVAVFVQT